MRKMFSAKLSPTTCTRLRTLAAVVGVSQGVLVDRLVDAAWAEHAVRRADTDAGILTVSNHHSQKPDYTAERARQMEEDA